MTVRLHATRGNIVDVAPARAQAAVLWVRTDYNMRRGGWFKILKRYLARLAPILSVPINPRAKPRRARDVDLGRPWATNADHLFRIKPADERLRYLYVFANPTNGHGYENVDLLSAYLRRCLRILTEHKLRRVAIIHMPLAVPRGEDRRPYDDRSARAMVETIGTWDQRNPDRIDDVYLVDLTNSFAQLVRQSQRTCKCESV